MKLRVAGVFFLFLAFGGSALATETQLRGLRSRQIEVEEEPTPQLGFKAPPPAFPVQPVDQKAGRGARHGFVNTTLGNLAFRVFGLRLPGRMPLDFGFTYDSAISDSMPRIPDPFAFISAEPRADVDLGKNWILGYSDYIVETQVRGLFLMAPSNGDLIYWQEQSNASFVQYYATPSEHLNLTRLDDWTLVEQRLDGTKWTYSTGTVGETNGLTTYGLVQVEDRSGNTITITHNQGYTARIENSDGSWIDFNRPIFDGDDRQPFPWTRVSSIVDSTGRRILLHYDETGRLISLMDVLDNEWTYAYNGTDKLISATDPLGNTYLTASYDTEHRVTSYEAQGGLLTFSYDSVGTTLVEDALGHEWTYAYAYNNLGSNGATLAIVEPTGGVHSFTRDAMDNPTSYIDPEGVTHNWTYDSFHRPLTDLSPGSNTPAGLSYDSVTGDVTSAQLATGGTTTFTRDEHGRVTEEADALGGLWTSQFAANGDRLTLRLPKGNLATQSGFLWQFEYDNFGNPTSVTDPTSRTFLREYSPQGDITALRNPNHLDTTTNEVIYTAWNYGRDALGRVTTVTDPIGSTWTTVYDAAGRIIEETGPSGSSRRYTYDSHHRLVAATLFDDASNPTYQLSYDDCGRLVESTTPAGHATVYAYDDSGRLQSVTDPENRATTYTRDLAGRLLSTTYPGGRVVTTTRDAHGRVADRTYPGQRAEHYTYNSWGALASAEATEPNWLGRVEWTYDSLGRIQSVRTEVSHESGHPEINLVSFTYDANGNRATRDDTPPDGTYDGHTTYSYDSLDRLTTAATQGYGTWTATYDPYTGNRSSVVHTLGLPAVNYVESWTYDLASRITGRAWDFAADDGQESWSYDAEGRLLAHDAPGVSESFVRNVLGQLATSTKTMTTSQGTAWTYDLDGQAQTRTDTHGDDSPVVTTFDRDAVGRPTRAEQGHVVRYYSWDDAPASDPLAASRVVRSSTSVNDPELEATFDFANRLRTIIGASAYLAAPVELVRNFWGPLPTDPALEIHDMDSDGSQVVSRAGMEVHGLYGQSRGHVTGGTQRFETHVNIIDRAAALQALAPESSTGISALSVPRHASSLVGALSVISDLRGIEARPTATSRDSLQATRFHVVDDWLAAPLASGAALISDDTTSSPTPLGGACGVYCRDKADRNTTNVNMCVGAPPIGFAAQPGGSHADCDAIVSCGIFGPSACGSASNPAPTCEYNWPEVPLNAPVDSHSVHAISPGGVELMSNSFVQTVTDISSYDPFGTVDFTRTYRSDSAAYRSLGHRWSHNWDEVLIGASNSNSALTSTQCPNKLRYIMSTGAIVEFVRASDGTYVTSDGSPYRSTFTSAPNILPTAGTIVDKSGTRRVFAGGALTEVLHGDHKITIVRTTSAVRILSGLANETGVERLYIQRDPSGKILRVGVRTDPAAHPNTFANYVDYHYSACNELDKVTRAPVTLGWDRFGNQLTTQRAPETTYQYSNVEGTCTTATALGYHQLVSVKEAQYEPITATESDYYPICNVYGGGTSINPNYRRVTAQCLGQSSCDSCTSASADLQYSLAWQPTVAGVTYHTTTLVDRRAEPSTQNDYSYREGFLETFVEDAGSGGLRRTTKYMYGTFTGLLLRTTSPDGSCEDTSYRTLWVGPLPEEVRRKTRERCLNPNASGVDLVTRYGYDLDSPFGGVRTITPPEAFPNGQVPAAFVSDPLGQAHNSAYCHYTTFIDYDYNQSDPVPGSTYADFLNPLASIAPEVLGDLNGDSTDDHLWFGRPVRTYTYRPDVACDPSNRMRSLTVLSKHGRPKSATTVAGLTTTYDYYPDAASVWDWRGASIAFGSTPANNPGPLARTIDHRIATSPAIPDLESWKAWSVPRADLAASEGPDGVRTEYTRDADGSVLETRICHPSHSSTQCVPGQTSDNVLSVSRVTMDLLGRVVREAIHDGSQASPPVLRARWYGYDELGFLRRTIADPDPTRAPDQDQPLVPPSSCNSASDCNDGDSCTNDLCIGQVCANYPTLGCTSPLHLVRKTWYRKDGTLLKRVSPAGRVTCLQFHDKLGLHTSVLRRGGLDQTPNGPDCPADHPDDTQQDTYRDSMGRTISMVDGRGVARFMWYDEYGRVKASGDGKPTGALDPILLTGQNGGPSPSLATTYSDNLYDAAGRVSRTRLYGSDGYSGQSGWLAASWFEFDALGRPTRTHRAFSKTEEKLNTVAGEMINADTVTPQEWLATSSVQYAAGLQVLTAPPRLIPDGLVQSTTDPFGRQTLLSYDGFARRTTVFAPPDEKPQRSKSEVQYDAVGRPTRTTETLLGIEADGSSISLEKLTDTRYDVWSRLRGTVRGPGSVDDFAEVALDALGQPVKTWHRWNTPCATPPCPTSPSPSDERTETTYDRVGRVLQTARLIGARDGSESWDTTTFTYDRDGLRETATDTRNQETRWHYDQLGRWIRVQYPAMSSPSDRDEIVAGHLVGGVLVDKYDGNGNLLSAEYRESLTRGTKALVLTNTYDSWLNLPTSRRAEYANGAAGWFSGTDKQTFAYDGAGRLVEAWDIDCDLTDCQQEPPPPTAGVITKRRYDSLGNLRHDEQILPLDGQAVSHVTTAAHTKDGFLEILHYPTAGYDLSFTANLLGGLATISGPSVPSNVNSPDTTLLSFTYLGGLPLVEHFQNNAERRWYAPEGVLYDAAGRQAGARTIDALTSSTVADFRYAYDRVGRLYSELRRHEQAGSNYRTRLSRSNRAGQLDRWVEDILATVPGAAVIDPTASVTAPDDRETWTLDALGNWSTHTSGVDPAIPADPTSQSSLASANALNQYTSVSTDGGPAQIFEYDWLGQNRADQANQERFVWDAFGRLTQVTTFGNASASPPVSPVVKTTFRYDALGRRVWQKPTTPLAGDNWIIYLSFGNTVLEERAIALSPYAETTRARYGYRGMQLLWMDRDVATAGASGPDPLTGSYSGTISKRFFVHTDHLGSTVAISELERTSGQLSVPERFTYSAYGAVTSWSGPWNGSSYSGALSYSRYGMPYLFTGQRQDPQLSSYSFRFRYYDPRTGRFRSRDPLLYKDGWSLYQYVGSSPHSKVDPLGLAGTVPLEKNTLGNWAEDAIRQMRVGIGPWGLTRTIIETNVTRTLVPLEGTSTVTVTDEIVGVEDPEAGVDRTLDESKDTGDKGDSSSRSERFNYALEISSVDLTIRLFSPSAILRSINSAQGQPTMSRNDPSRNPACIDPRVCQGEWKITSVSSVLPVVPLTPSTAVDPLADGRQPKTPKFGPTASTGSDLIVNCRCNIECVPCGGGPSVKPPIVVEGVLLNGEGASSPCQCPQPDVTSLGCKGFDGNSNPAGCK